MQTPEDQLRETLDRCATVVKRCLQDSRPEVKGAARLADTMLYHHHQLPFQAAQSFFSYLAAELEEIENPNA